MNRPLSLPLSRLLLPGFAAFCLTACGGGGDAAGGAVEPARAEPASAITTTLLEDDGSTAPADPRTVPNDFGARTRAGRYASPRQAEQLERALGEGVLRVNVECCGIEAAEQAMAIAYGLQAAHDLPNSTPVLVRAADLRLGATVADRLADAGYPHVWLVTR